jgi:3'-5' exonuclease
MGIVLICPCSVSGNGEPRSCRRTASTAVLSPVTEAAVDLCDVLGSYVPGAKVKLDDVSKILGLSGKPVGIDGSRVEEMVLAGQIEEVARYCESDVVNTYRVWLVYELFRGSITAQELDWSEAQIRDFVAKQKTANSHLSASLGLRTLRRHVS